MTSDRKRNVQNFSVKFLRHTDAVDALRDFSNENEEVKQLQLGQSLQVQNARFERAFVYFVNKFLSRRSALEVTTVKEFANYELK